MNNNLRKVIFTLFALSLLSLSVSAQLKVGVQAGMNASQIHGDGFATNGLKSGFQIGATVDYQLKNHWVLKSGLSFVQQSGSLRENGNTDGSYFFHQINPRINYLVVPLKVGYNIHVNDHINIIPSIGIYGAYGLSGSNSNIEQKELDATNKYPKIDYIKWNPYNSEHIKFKRADFGVTGGADMVLDKHVFISINYLYGLKDLEPTKKFKNTSLQLSVGYIF